MRFEPLRPAGDPAVLSWLDQRNIETLFLSAISLAELRYAVAALPDGQRKEGLGAAVEGCIVALFGPRLLAFDSAAGAAYADIRARTKAAGHPVAAADGYIAATAAGHGFTGGDARHDPVCEGRLPVINPREAA